MLHMRSRTVIPSALLALLAAGTTPAQGNGSGAFIVRLGTDTVYAERFTRSARDIQVEQVIRRPETSLRHTHIALSGQVTEVTYMLHRIGAAPDAPLLGSTTLTFAGDSVRIAVKRGDSTLAPRTIAAPAGAIPALPNSYLAYEMAAMRLRAAKRDSVDVVFVGVGNQPPSRIVARKHGADSVLFVTPGQGTLRARVDREGRLLSLRVPDYTVRVAVERVRTVDIEALARSWSGTRLGILSPPDSVIATVGGANIALNYSKPSRRGRTVFGGELVPWNVVWRVGANAATTLRTDRDLVISGTPVPAGTYTLWMLPTPSGTKLIINKQTLDANGRPLWGTMYDQSQDLARVDVATTKLAAPAEQFTVSVDPAGAGGTIRMVWDTAWMTVPFTVK